MSSFLRMLLTLLLAWGPHLWARTLISKPELPWVDVKPISGEKPGRGQTQQGGSSAANRRGGIEYTQPGARGAGSGDGSSNTNGGDDNGDDGGGDEAARTATNGGGQLRVHDKWWPVCAFVDERLPEGQVNAALKGMVEMADRCGVNVVIWPRTVKRDSWRDDPGEINQKSVEKCNIVPKMGAAGSATALVPWPYTAAKMCKAVRNNDNDPAIDADDWNGNVAGCAQLRSGTSQEVVTQNEQSGKGDEDEGEGGGGVASGGVAPSIEVPRGIKPDTVAHEAQGHSQFGKPNGKKYGLGIGDDPDAPAPGGAGWSPAGCAVMRATALPNVKQYGFDPQRQSYYTVPRDPKGYYDMQTDPPIFTSTPQVAFNGGGTRLLPTPFGQTIRVLDGAPKKGAGAVSSSGTATENSDLDQDASVEEGDPSGRHRRKSLVGQLLDGLKENGSSPDDPDSVQSSASRLPAAKPVKSGPRLGYDDDAPKGRRASGGETSPSKPDVAEMVGEALSSDGTTDRTTRSQKAPRGSSASDRAPRSQRAPASLPLY